MSFWFNKKPKIVIAHSSFDIKSLVDEWAEPTDCVWAKNKTELVPALTEADILVTMTLWEPRFLALAPQLKLLQTMTSGVEQYDTEAFRARGVHLASARGVNANAVAEHAIALMFSHARRLWEARDDQRQSFWRKLARDRSERRHEIAGTHVVIVGFGAIGARLATMCLALGQTVTVVRKNVTADSGLAITTVSDDQLPQAVEKADYVILACPATPETRGLVNGNLLKRMKPTACLINVARGSVIVETDLIAALRKGQIGMAALDTFEQEPLPETSPLWSMPNVLITPHCAGDTVAYESRVADILHENVRRLVEGKPLINQIV
ncbi:glyoxylate reductase GyaR [Acetobacter aceti NRIC 0242]|uniref:3-phosphoglycerate dehydrogenase n=1 Tax=Acetobacter aceti NBRC 14818 TaxID=887700 RepID=A0AB33IBR0_ACEAC|nr:D-2-hydroxyacid dehydrogenase [Acetobacter aceti]TCS32824.1 phosphoglycerate dehydrogenase-like enzyme [Acetobacter aceti NBRC 14818]BCK74763.1 3-phosphoglycerate dehydrogenase [Acetobacter aceti NBRC 14818]GAN58058.1 D-isomer specific 2-hydroxyacid dehydrogenase [Acetobacter aceti NBRC 14818]GBO81006.1 glyoxylate reductase GyaR [Acetobacter aceti NRIC 0242]